MLTQREHVLRMRLDAALDSELRAHARLRVPQSHAARIPVIDGLKRAGRGEGLVEDDAPSVVRSAQLASLVTAEQVLALLQRIVPDGARVAKHLRPIAAQIAHDRIDELPPIGGVL